MPMFSKMMGSYPFQVIRGLSPSVRMAAGAAGAGAIAGGVAAGRGRRGRGMMAGAAAGALGAGAYAARGQLSTLGRNMMRPGVASMVGRSAVTSAGTGLAGLARRTASMINRLR